MNFPHIPRIAAILAGIAWTLLCFASSVQATLLLDGGFETPVIPKDTYSIMDQSQLPGWQSTATDHKIEIWSTPFNGVSAYQGNQFVEINANMQEAIYQDVAAVPTGELLNFGFAHRGRATVESIRFTLTDLGADGIYGTADDTTLFSKTYSDGTGAWDYYSNASESQILTKGNAIRVTFASLTPGSVGNFLDAVSLTNATIAPEPETWAALSLLCFASFGRTALRQVCKRKKAKVCP